MRNALILVLVVGTSCGRDAKTPPHSDPPPVTVPSQPAVATLGMEGVKLLEPESVFGARVPDVKAYSELLKSIAARVTAYDVAHPKALPATVDVVVVARANATRIWLVGPAGDIAVPELEADVAKLAPAPIKERHAAAVVMMTRAGAPVDANDDTHRLPSAWGAAAGAQGGDIDTVIDKVWPR